MGVLCILRVRVQASFISTYCHALSLSIGCSMTRRIHSTGLSCPWHSVCWRTICWCRFSYPLHLTFPVVCFLLCRSSFENGRPFPWLRVYRLVEHDWVWWILCSWIFSWLGLWTICIFFLPWLAQSLTTQGIFVVGVGRVVIRCRIRRDRWVFWGWVRCIFWGSRCRFWCTRDRRCGCMWGW